MNRIPRSVYTKELRDEAVKLALTEGVGVSEVLTPCHADSPSVRECREPVLVKKRCPPDAEDHPMLGQPPAPFSKADRARSWQPLRARQEITRAEAELKRVTEERGILNKAAPRCLPRQGLPASQGFGYLPRCDW